MNNQPERSSEMTSIGSLLTRGGRLPKEPWPPVDKRPWVVFRRRQTPQAARGIKTSSYLEPLFDGSKWREFYQWAQSYTQGPREPRIRTLPGECAICGDSGYVLTKRRQLKPCPRWSEDTKECWKYSVEPLRD